MREGIPVGSSVRSHRTAAPGPRVMRLSAKEKIGFGLGDAASNLIWATLVSFSMYYYTDVFGISATAVGTLLLFARVFAILDFSMGAIADRTETRWGKFRPYLLWMCLPLAGITVAAFTVPDFDDSGKLVYAWVTYNLLMVAYSAINIPYSALSGVMTDDPGERTSLNSYRMVLAQCGGFLVNGATLPLVKWFGKGDQATGFQLTAALFGMLAVAFFLATFATTRERLTPAVPRKTRVMEDLQRLFSNPHWVIMFLAGMFGLAFIIVRAGSLVYHAKYVLRWDEAKTTAYLLAGNAGIVAGAFITWLWVKRIGKRHTVIAAHFIMGITALSLYWTPASATFGIFSLQVLHAMGGGLNAVLFFAMIADTADYSEWKHGVRSTGIAFSATTCAQKIGMGVGGAFAGIFLTRCGYVANVEQTATAAHGILLLVSLIPGVGFLLVGALFYRYGLTEALCGTIRQEMAARRADG